MTFREMIEKKKEQHDIISVYAKSDISLITYDFPVEMIYEEENDMLTIEGKNGAITVSMKEEPEYDASDNTYGFRSSGAYIWIW